jgi:DNA-binding transcriptional MerR regulator
MAHVDVYRFLPLTDGTQATLTIDELARETGMTVRNVRAYHSRGLLPPPEVRGRTGYYGDEHRARIDLVRDLQAEGFNLEAIRRLLDTAGGASQELLRFTQVARAPFEDEQTQVVTAEELGRRWGGGNARMLERAIELGLLRPLGDGRYEEMSPSLARAAGELAALGISAEATMELATRLRRHADGAARAFIRLFVEEVWRPFEEAGRPAERWPAVREALERLRPLAAESLLAIFRLAMSDSVEEAFGRELGRLGREPSTSRARRRGKRAKRR